MCSFYAYLGDDKWPAFQISAQPLETLDPGVAAAIADSASFCN
jgi:hypothetical protein